MANLKYGSSGSDVEKLQNALIDKGYDVGSTGADGVFGKNTQAAVKAYQKANGLAVDGIAGSNTLGSLYGTSTTTTTTNTANKDTSTTTPTTGESTKQDTTVTSPSGFTYGDFSYADFQGSDLLNQANSLIQQQQANKPGSYTPVWQDEADAYLSQYQNRDPFSYDFNSDALYNQYKDNYIRQGQMAMMDTMGQAAALTGGYGNSYAQSVGQQAYNQQLSQLNNILPELWQMAQDRYTQEGNELLAMYDLYTDRENQEYGRYLDSVDVWSQEMDRLTNNYNTLYNREYSDYLDKKQTAYDEYQTDRSEEWEKYLANQDKEQTAAELMASAGNYDRLKDVYGLTDAEVAAIKDANTPKATGGTPTSDDKKYAKWDTDADKYWTTLLNNAGSEGAVESIGTRMRGVGYDPQFVASIVDGYLEKYIEKEGTIPNQSPLKGVGGGVGDKVVAMIK